MLQKVIFLLYCIDENRKILDIHVNMVNLAILTICILKFIIIPVKAILYYC